MLVRPLKQLETSIGLPVLRENIATNMTILASIDLAEIAMRVDLGIIWPQIVLIAIVVIGDLRTIEGQETVDGPLVAEGLVVVDTDITRLCKMSNYL